MNERLKEYSGILSHSLRNPLNVAQGRLQLAKGDCDSEHLADVANAHDRMETLTESLLTPLTENLLTLARTGADATETEPVSLERLSETCWRTVPTADATPVIDTGRHLPADRNRLRQLLENLFRNAVEHTDESVVVTVGKTDTGFYVEDDGPGIPTAERESVLETGHSTAHEGTGLGLSIVKGVVEAHGWSIRITDGSHGGARFEISNAEYHR